MPITTRNRPLDQSPSNKFLTNHTPKAIYAGNYELTAAIEEFEDRGHFTRMPAQRANPYTIGVSASRKSLINAAPVGKMVAGSTKYYPIVPHETRQEIM